MAIRGVPRERPAISSAASSSISTARIDAERRTIVPSWPGLVVPEPEGHPEAVAQRRRQQARARRRTDERERRQVDRERARCGSLPEDDVEAEVLERRVEDLLGRTVEAVDLVDEEHVARLDRGEDRGDVLLLERRPGDRAEPDTELLADDLRQRRLAEARRPGEQDVIERLVAPLGGVERDAELLLDPLLADEVVEPARPQGALDLVVLGVQHGGRDAVAHKDSLGQSPDGTADIGRQPVARSPVTRPATPTAPAPPAAAPGRRRRGAARPRAPSTRARRARPARRGAPAPPPRPGRSDPRRRTRPCP